MIQTSNKLSDDYQKLLADYLAGKEEAALGEAYQLGRQAVTDGVLPLVTVHHEALRSALEGAHSAEEVVQDINAALAVMVESMAVIEMALRGYQEANSRLQAEIVEHKKTQDELRKAREAADAANRAKSEFLASMSHEIRTPLNAIIGLTDLVLDTPVSMEQRDYLSMVRDSGDSLLTVINDILDFSKIESGHLQMERVPFEHAEVLGDTMKSLALRAHSKGLELLERISDEIPPVLVGDPGRLRQVVVNLVGNAIKFTEQGEILLDVQVESQTEDEVELHYRVRDTGIGIAPDKLDVIFGAFQQAEAAMTRRYGGTGLGLAICTRLVQMMEGRIWVESQPGRGSTFHFTGRFGIADEAATPRRPAERAALRGLPILVVDDNATNRRILEEMLREWQMQPTLAAEGAEALIALRQAVAVGRPYRLVVTDAHMPTMDGFSLAEQIERDAQLRDTLIMMLSSGDRPGDITRCQQLGVAAYLIKPVKRSELFEALLLALGIAAEAAETVRAPGAAPVRPLRILLAEDSPVNQKLAVALLEKAGHTVETANNGRESLEKLDADRFDLVLMDVQMPEMDGLDATRALRARERQTGARVPIIAMTAHAMKGDRERCLEAGMDGYVAKPVRTRELFAAIATVLEEVSAGPASPAIAQGGPAGPKAAQAIDWSMAEEATHGDVELLKDLVREFLHEIPRLMTSLQEGLSRGDAAAVCRAAHTLKGDLQIFGAQAAGDYAQQIELQAREGDLQARPLVAALQRELNQVQSELAEFAAKGGERQHTPL